RAGGGDETPRRGVCLRGGVCAFDGAGGWRAHGALQLMNANAPIVPWWLLSPAPAAPVGAPHGREDFAGRASRAHGALLQFGAPRITPVAPGCAPTWFGGRGGWIGGGPASPVRSGGGRIRPGGCCACPGCGRWWLPGWRGRRRSRRGWWRWHRWANRGDGRRRAIAPSPGG